MNENTQWKSIRKLWNFIFGVSFAILPFPLLVGKGSAAPHTDSHDRRLKAQAVIIMYMFIVNIVSVYCHTPSLQKVKLVIIRISGALGYSSLLGPLALRAGWSKPRWYHAVDVGRWSLNKANTAAQRGILVYTSTPTPTLLIMAVRLH